MKKRILSMAIVVVMIVAMIPAMVLSTSGISYYDGYDSAMVSAGAINVDASETPDAAYLAGEKIISRNLNGAKANSFEAYVAGDANGVYFWFDVVDTTTDKASHYKEKNDESTGYLPVFDGYKASYASGDRLQVYYRGDAHNGATFVGSIGFDYVGQMAIEYRFGSPDSSLVDFDYKVTETGWVAELYVPWAALSSALAGLTTEEISSFKIGIQCNDYTNDGTDKIINLCYDTKRGGSYYRGMYSNHSFDKGAGNGSDKDLAGSWQGTLCVPINFVGVQTAVVSAAPTVDGVMDAAYAKSEKIVSNVDGFYGYTLATTDGLYVFANLADTTLDKPADVTVDKGDKFQLYFQMGNLLSDRNWGYIEMDYTTDDVKPNFRYVAKGGFYNNAPVEANMQHAFTTSEEGWTAEVFIPWAGSVALDGLNQFTQGTVSVMLQFNDYTHTPKAEGGYTHSARNYALSNGFGGGAWYDTVGTYGPSGSFYLIPLVFNFDADVQYDYNRWAVYVDSITLDGEKDDKYIALAGEDVDDYVYVEFDGAVEGFNKGGTYNKINMANVYYAFTDTDMYIYIEVLDNTVSSTKTYEYACVYYEQSDWAGKWNLSATGEYNSNANYDYIEGKGRTWTLYNGSNGDTANLALTYEGTKTAYTGYNIEFKMALTEEEKAALAAGEAIQIGVGVEINNAGTDGKRTHYGYSVEGGGYWYQQNANRGKVSMPNVVLDRNNTAANVTLTPEIKSASVTLGDTLAMNYYTTLPAKDAADYQMRFTFNDKVTYATATKGASANEFVFSFKGIAPQCVGDNIKAELMRGDEVVDVKDNYSVFQNCMNIVNDNPTNMALINLVGNLGAYAAAAQNYANYKTDALVNAGFEGYATTVDTIVNSDKTLDGEAREDFGFTAAGVYFDYANKVYAKFIAPEGAIDFEEFSITINGVEAYIAETGVTTELGIEYIVYTDYISVTDFDEVFTFVLTDGFTTQTLTYSVNAYCKAKLNAEKATTAALAAATYSYGAAAEAYVA